RLGSMESTAASRLPTVLAKYHQQWPDVNLQLTTGASRQLLDAVNRREIDCAFVALLANSDIDGIRAELVTKGLAGQPVYSEELMLLLPGNHPPLKDVNDLQVKSLVTFKQGCAYRTFAENWVRQVADNHPVLRHI